MIKLNINQSSTTGYQHSTNKIDCDFLGGNPIHIQNVQMETVTNKGGPTYTTDRSTITFDSFISTNNENVYILSINKSIVHKFKK